MAHYSVTRGVAVIRMDNPPLTLLSQKVRSGLRDCIQRADKDTHVKAVVLCGSNNTFSAGATDLHEVDGRRKEPWLTEVGDLMDYLKKPIVAAIEGVAVGGGLEAALFCHYRIVSNTAILGLIEAQFGACPGEGGTQRLSRAVGLQTALDMTTSGARVSAVKALELGFVDKVVTGDVVEAAINFALSKAHIDPSLVCLRFRNVNVSGDLDQISEAAMARVKTKYRGFNAPVHIVRAVIASAQLSYEKGMEKEKEFYEELRTSSQFKALTYAFFAERAIAKWHLPNGGNYKTAKPLPVKTTGVIGAGTMGGGIALSLITSGLPCVLVEQNKKFLDKGLEIMKAQLMGTVQRGKMTANQAKKCVSLLKPSVNLEDMKDVDLVIEAVYENLKLKHEIFSKLDTMCKPATILCSNTSSIDIDKIASVVKRRDKVVGTHFFAPSYIMKLVENIYGKETSAETVATVMKLGKTIGKVPVLVGTCTGFVANRMGDPYQAESLFLVEEGASVEQIAICEKDFGMPMDRFEVSDLAGMDVGYRIRREAAKSAGVELTTDSKFFIGERTFSLSDRMVEKGRLGKKVGKGWYKYDGQGRRNPTLGREAIEIIEEHRRKMGITPRAIGSQEILERLHYSLINVGFKILEEGLCTMPQEIDVIWFYGFGWPKHTGGPMFYASQIGLKRVYDRMCYYHQKFPHSMHWVPSPLLAKLSKSDVPLDKWEEVARAGSKL